MSALLYIIGLILGITLFIYLYSTYQSGKEKIREFKGKPPEPKIEPDQIAFYNVKRPPGTRLCPLCGKALTKYEALYASEVEDSRGKRILIHGCKYCYKPEEDNGEGAQ